MQWPRPPRQAALVFVVFTVCSVLLLDNAFAAVRPKWGVMAYLSGQGGLEQEAAAYWQAIIKAAADGHCAAAVQIDGPYVCARWLAVPGNHCNWQPLGLVNMGAQPTLTRFLEWARGNLSADRYLLIVMGHGTGLATLAPDLSGVAFDGGSSDTLSIAELSAALAEAHVADRPIELVSLQACYAASIEVAYSLRQTANYLVASPDRVPSPGLPWAQVLPRLNGCDDGRAAVVALYAEYERALGRLDLRAVVDVAARLKALVEALSADTRANAPALRLVRSRSPNWGYRDEMCDLLYLARLLHEMAATREVSQRAGELEASLERALVPGPGRQAANANVHVGNLGIFFPATWEQVPPHYGSTYRLAAETGWAKFLQAYYDISGN